WADQLRPDELYGEEEVPRIRPSRGTHVTISPDQLKLEAGVIVPAGGGRTVFVLPWLGRALVGTTDNDYEGPLDHVPASDEDIAYLLEAVNTFFGSAIGPGDLTGAYAGVRPLISTGDPKKSVDISRRAELYETSSGLVTITGGKLTTWRRMAKLAVDRIVERDGREAPCRTHEIPIGQPQDPADVDYILEATNAFFGRDLTPDDVTGAYAGVRPLISTGDPKKSVDISRKAELYETSSGMITITGGKLTTFRRMAKMAVDRLVERESRDAPCRTHEIPLGLTVDPDDLRRVEGVPSDSYRALAARYGFAAHDVLRVAAERGELAQPVVSGLPDLLAEAAFAARREQALTVGDVLLRRTRLGLLAARELDDGPARRVAAALGAERRWDAARIDAEVERWRAESAAEGLVVRPATRPS
ncbi:MAG TPA: glycerol-3-phosphate dehydrogenase C-terminal domain-containing protein, partial [Solirubrobacteraceae bacterium]